MNRLVLASTSPRRRQLLEQSGYKFRTSTVKVSEIPQENLNLEAQIEDIARRKATALLTAENDFKNQGVIILSADTVVVLDGEFLGKPANKSQWKEHLFRLSGKKHLVKTGVCILEFDSKRDATFCETTEIEFHDLTPEQVEEYVATGSGLDKAGGYGIQDELSSKFVKNINGSFNNVVGLPVEKLEKVFAENGWQFDRG